MPAPDHRLVAIVGVDLKSKPGTGPRKDVFRGGNPIPGRPTYPYGEFLIASRNLLSRTFSLGVFQRGF